MVEAGEAGLLVLDPVAGMAAGVGAGAGGGGLVLAVGVVADTLEGGGGDGGGGGGVRVGEDLATESTRVAALVLSPEDDGLQGGVVDGEGHGAQLDPRTSLVHIHLDGVGDDDRSPVISLCPRHVKHPVAVCAPVHLTLVAPVRRLRHPVVVVLTVLDLLLLLLLLSF